MNLLAVMSIESVSAIKPQMTSLALYSGLANSQIYNISTPYINFSASVRRWLAMKWLILIIHSNIYFDKV